MPIPVARMKKATLIWMSNHKCKHGHDYISHYSCYLTEQPDKNRLGFLDIESSNLHANWGIILSYAIKAHNEDKIYSRTISSKELRTCLDKEVVRSCVEDMKKFDILATYYGTRFDMPFIRTRAITLGINFPEYAGILHKDVYYMARNKLCLNSNRLDNVCEALFGSTTKTRLKPDKWTKALTGDKAALDYINDHNIHDVIELERVYNALVGYTKNLANSL